MVSMNSFMSIKWLVIAVRLLILFQELSSTRSQSNFTYSGAVLQCPKSLSCAGRCTTEQEWDNGAHTEPHCHCDPQCSTYTDCCADYQKHCANQTNPSTSTRERFECVHLNESKPGIWMVNTCPSSYKDQTIIRKCLASSQKNRTITSANYLDELPMFNLITHIPYRNKYCAVCNGLTSDYHLLAYFDLQVKCNIRHPTEYNDTQIIDFYLKYCTSISMDLPSDRMRRFCFPTVSTCPIHAPIAQREACLYGFTAIVYSVRDKTDYRNQHCMQCNGLAGDVTCGPRRGAPKFFNPKSFEVLMEFIPTSRSVKVEKKNFQIRCDKGYMYDLYLEVCRRAIKMDPYKGISDKYRIKMWLSPLDGREPENITHIAFKQSLVTRFNLRTQQIDVISLKVEDRTTTILFDLHASKTGGRGVPRAERNNVLQISALLNFNHSFPLNASHRAWLVLKVTSLRLACVKPQVYQPGQYQYRSYDNTVEINTTHGREVLTPKQFYITKANDSLKRDQSTVFVCRSLFSVGCNHVMLSLRRNEYTFYTNNSLLYIPTGQQYLAEEYIVEGGIPWICTNRTSHLSTNFTLVVNSTTVVIVTRGSVHITVRRYMTIVGLTISVVSLFLVLLTHVILPDLRAPLPGKNLMSLALSLFLAHLWYLFASGETDKTVFCTAAAVTLHYLFLVSFGCTAVVAYDTRRTFSQKIAKAHAMGSANHCTRFAVYIMLSWGVPVVVVGTCFALDWYQVVTIGYGNENACWLTDVDAQLVAFATPIGCVLVYNVVAFSQTIWAINNARKQTISVKTSHHTRPGTVKIYTRLISLMGFSWFFGISAALIHEALMYPFVVLTTLQGLYIFIAFVCKARVLRMFKEKLPLDKQKQVRRVTKRTTMTTDCRTTTPYAQYRSEGETTI